eukprot:TRINITY_DN2911_c0_g1_i1.p1 TRINITY_DN2911_c0_g1~~TRINITY_DN2911_c0_g1_i1.p1  ORF type:complete len:245 (-),score=29.01 TRINITY_DN2911_c0_g1_i1:616-1350(-)
MQLSCEPLPARSTRPETLCYGSSSGTYEWLMRSITSISGSLVHRRVAFEMPASNKMESRLRSRIKAIVGALTSAVHIAYGAVLTLIVLFSLFFTWVLYHVYPPSIFLLLFVVVLAVMYVNSKKALADDILEQVDTAVSPSKMEESGQTQGQQKTILQRVLHKGVDAILSAAADSFMIVPGVIALIGVVLFVLGYHPIGVTVLFFAACLLGVTGCSCSIIKRLAYGWVDRLVLPVEPDETTNLVT